MKHKYFQSEIDQCICNTQSQSHYSAFCSYYLLSPFFLPLLFLFFLRFDCLRITPLSSYSTTHYSRCVFSPQLALQVQTDSTPQSNIISFLNLARKEAFSCNSCLAGSPQQLQAGCFSRFLLTVKGGPPQMAQGLSISFIRQQKRSWFWSRFGASFAILYSQSESTSPLSSSPYPSTYSQPSQSLESIYSSQYSGYFYIPSALTPNSQGRCGISARTCNFNYLRLLCMRQALAQNGHFKQPKIQRHRLQVLSVQRGAEIWAKKVRGDLQPQQYGATSIESKNTGGPPNLEGTSSEGQNYSSLKRRVQSMLMKQL